MATEKNNATPFVIAGVSLLAYFGVLRPLLQKLGVTETEKTELNNNATLWLAWQPNFTSLASAGLAPITGAQAVAYAKVIKDAIGGFFGDDKEPQIFGAIKSLKNALQLSEVCAAFQSLYKSDMYSELKAALSESELYELNLIVKKLPTK